jgi:hypothetical protein
MNNLLLPNLLLPGLLVNPSGSLDMVVDNRRKPYAAPGSQELNRDATPLDAGSDHRHLDRTPPCSRAATAVSTIIMVGALLRLQTFGGAILRLQHRASFYPFLG